MEYEFDAFNVTFGVIEDGWGHFRCSPELDSLVVYLVCWEVFQECGDVSCLVLLKNQSGFVYQCLDLILRWQIGQC